MRESTDVLAKKVMAAKRLAQAQVARDDLLTFMKFTMPDPNDPNDAMLSLYEERPVARLLCKIMEQVHERKMKRVAISIGPQRGKSQVISRGFPAWVLGKNPRLNLMLGSYNQDKADEFGDDTRHIISAGAYRQIFGENLLRVGGKAKDLLQTEQGGKAAFVGRGGSGTGKPADIFIVDDPLKDDQEAQSDATRNQVWNWFNKVAMTRCHQNSAIVVVHTRWHLDDLIGRLCDPEHPERHKKYAGIAEKWKYINIPAIIQEQALADALGLTLEIPTDPFVVSMFGQKPMVSLAPSTHSLEFLAEAKQMDPTGFSALNMGRPTPEDGDLIKAEWLAEYDREDLPDDLMIYGASDHALGESKRNDPSVIGCVGVDSKDDIWVLPDLVWDRMQTDRIVEELLIKMKQHKPFAWWLENENISKAFGPFLIKRMNEEKTYCVLDGNSVAKDKVTRSSAIRGRMAMKKVRFPRFAPWWPQAKAEMLHFPNGAHDDFVDFIAHIGLGLLKQHRPTTRPETNDNVVQVGSIQWILAKAAARARREQRDKAAVSW